MKMWMHLAGTALPLIGAAVLTIAGCGIVTAPASLPMAVAENGNFSLKGPLVDMSGQPLDAVLVSQELNHHFWTPIEGGADTDEKHLRRFDRFYSISERGADLGITFTRDGYRTLQRAFHNGDPKVVHTDKGDWPNAANFPIVFFPSQPGDLLLSTWDDDVDYSNYPQQTFINMNRVSRQGNIQEADGRADQLEKVAPNMFYLTLVKEMPKAINSHGEIDPLQVNLPGYVTLHITGEHSGFQRIEPRVGYGPMQVSDTAPEGDYQPTLTIQRPRLMAMRKADTADIIQAHEYFYFRAGDRYGKGFIRWFNPHNDSPPPLVFHFVLKLQPAANDRNLQTHDARNY